MQKTGGSSIKKLVALTTIFVVVVFVSLLPCVLSVAEAALYWRIITLTPVTPATDYQVRVELIPGNFDYSMANTNGEDVRFADVNGNPLNFWIEQWDTFGTSVIWVKVANAGTTSFYMYYGDPSAVSASDGYSTFDYFEDFDNISDWTAYGTGATLTNPSAGVMQLDNPLSMCRNWAAVEPTVSFDNFVLGMRYRFQRTQEEGGPLVRIPGSAANSQIDGYQIALRGRGSNDMPAWRMTNMNDACGGISGLGNSSTGWAVDFSWYRGKLVATPGTLNWYPAVYAHAGTQATYSDSTYTSGNIGLWIYSDSRMQIDFLFVRQYAATEPTATVGRERPNIAVPAMTTWGIIIFIILAGIGSLVFLRKTMGVGVMKIET